MRTCVLSCFSRVQLRVTPWTAAHPASLSMGILQVRILAWVAMPSSRGSSQPRDRTHISCIPGGFLFYQSPWGSPIHTVMQMDVGPSLQSIFMVVSGDLTSLVPDRTENGHMRKSWWKKDFLTGVILGSSCSTLLHWSSPTQVIQLPTSQFSETTRLCLLSPSLDWCLETASN